jgi:YbbR domain-containing protein
LNITPDNIVLPPGIRLKEVVPSVVEVTLDVPVRKELPVQVDWSGKLPDELLLVRATVDPQRITVIGGSRILEQTATIYTQKVPLDTLRTSGALEVELALTPASIELAPGSKAVATVSYVIRTTSDTSPPP